MRVVTTTLPLFKVLCKEYPQFVGPFEVDQYRCSVISYYSLLGHPLFTFTPSRAVHISILVSLSLSLPSFAGVARASELFYLKSCCWCVAMNPFTLLCAVISLAVTLLAHRCLATKHNVKYSCGQLLQHQILDHQGELHFCLRVIIKAI